MNSDRRSALGPILLAALCVLFFSNALLFGGVFSYRDLLLFHYPLRHAWVSGVQNGTLPFLNALLNGGQPILSNPNNSVFYPGNVLYFLLDFDNAWNFTLAGHAFWAGLGLYFLARRLRCNIPAAFAGAVVFSFGGPLVSCLTYYNLLITGSWIPWAILGCMNFFESKSRYIGAVVPLAFLLLAGEPTILLITALLLFGLWLLHSRNPERTFGAHFWSGVLLVVPALLIAAVQLVPAILWLPHTLRGEGLDFRLAAAYWSFHPYRFIEFLSPAYYGDAMSSYVQDFWGGSLSDSGYPYVINVYCGWLPFLLVPFAAKRKAGKLALVIAISALLFSLGHRLPGYKAIFDYLPLYQVIRYPEKFLIFAQFGIALVAALGCNEAMRAASKKPAIVTGAALLVALIVLLVAGGAESLTPEQLMKRNNALYQALLAGFLSTAVIVLTGSRRLQSISKFLIPLVLTLDLLSSTFGLAATTPRSEMRRIPEIVQSAASLKSDVLYHREMEEEYLLFSGSLEPELLLRESLYPLYGMVFGVSYGAASDIDRMLWLEGQKRAAEIRHAFPSDDFLRMAKEYGIGHILSIAPMAGQAIHLETKVEVGSRVAFLYKLNKRPYRLAHWIKGKGELAWVEERPYSLRVNARATEAASIRVLRNAIPGWQLLINGEKTDVTADSSGWITIPVEAGNRVLELSYAPPGFLLGSLLSILGIIAAAMVRSTAKERERNAPVVMDRGR